MNLNKIKTDFDNLEANKQWLWLINTDLKNYFQIGLDNDTTSICFDSDSDAEADYIMYFKSDIGNREGVTDLLNMLGCKVEGV